MSDPNPYDPAVYNARQELIREQMIQAAMRSPLDYNAMTDLAAAFNAKAERGEDEDWFRLYAWALIEVRNFRADKHKQQRLSV